jgi:ELWxxDGT repeat protein
MKKITICFSLLISMFYSGHCQVPEIIMNNLTVSNTSAFAVMDSIYYFQGHDGDNDQELWRTDGTEAGTYRVANVNSAGSSYANQLTRVGDTLFFMASNNDAAEQLYLTDGTEEGTQWVFDVDPSALEQYHMLTASGGLLYFRTHRPNIYTELWVSDGTTANTHMVADICENLGSNPNELTDFNGSLAFLAENCEKSGYSLYITQGLNGTITLLGGDHAGGLVAIGDRLYFRSTFEDYGGELSVSAGIAPDVTRLTDINPGEFSAEIYHLTKLDSLVLFRAYEPDHGAELWSYNPQSGTSRLVKDINPGPNNSSFPDQLITYKGKLYFSASDGVHGTELWVSDGTEAGTVMLKNINEEPGDVAYHSNPAQFFATEDLLYFRADDFIHGAELWQTDGTEQGTRMTADIWASGNQSSDPGGFAQVGDYLVFNAWYNKRTLFGLNMNPGSTDGVEDAIRSTLFRIYPNPAITSINIESVTGSRLQYTILDISGRKVLNGSVPGGGQTSLNISSLKPGLYFMKADTGQGCQTEKFTIQ